MSTPKKAPAKKNEPSNEINSSSEEEYKVGPGNPPKHSQFKKGNTFGKGQKKGAKATKTIVKEALGMKVKTNLGGKTKNLTKVELALHQLATKASGGDLKAIEKVIALQQLYGPQEDPDGPPPKKLKLDRDTLRDHLEMLDLLYPPEPDEEDDEDAKEEDDE